MEQAGGMWGRKDRADEGRVPDEDVQKCNKPGGSLQGWVPQNTGMRQVIQLCHLDKVGNIWPRCKPPSTLTQLTSLIEKRGRIQGHDRSRQSMAQVR